MKNANGSKRWSLMTIGFHFLTVVLHSIAHEALAVRATPAQLAFIVPVIVFGPVVAGFLLLRFEKAGGLLLALAMTGSFFFGLYYHFIARTIDHVGHVAALRPAFWSAVFIATAYLLAASEIVGAFVAVLILKGQSHHSENYAARTSI